MTLSYHILAGGRVVETLTADPSSPEGRESVLTALRRVHASSTARVTVEGRASGPDLLAETLNAILTEIEAAHDNHGREAAQ
ncbi:MAG: hypothetical protein HS116_19210 [Planctomycetes bacterium]|nr:hypothetical protein [Planctomycetota bacterium]